VDGLERGRGKVFLANLVTCASLLGVQLRARGSHIPVYYASIATISLSLCCPSLFFRISNCGVSVSLIRYDLRNQNPSPVVDDFFEIPTYKQAHDRKQPRKHLIIRYRTNKQSASSSPSWRTITQRHLQPLKRAKEPLPLLADEASATEREGTCGSIPCRRRNSLRPPAASSASE